MATETDAQTAIFAEIVAERERQDQIWGGPAHDDSLNPYTWLQIIGRERVEAYMAWLDASIDWKMLGSYRRELVHVAAVCVAAIEALDRQKGGG